MSLYAYAAVALLGIVIGYAELISRYRDQPSAIVRSGSAWSYMAVNALASMGALRAAEIFGWDFGIEDAQQQIAVQVIACGFGAMALIRTSLANVAINGKDTPIGIITVLDAVLATADRGVDRARSKQRFEESKKYMADVSFDKAKTVLPTAVLAAMQNASSAEAEDLRKNISAIDNSDQPDGSKAIQLGLTLMKLSGPKGLDAAIKSVDSDIKRDAVVVPQNQSTS